MLCFTSDYIAGAHPQILKRLEETNLENLAGYGRDKYCDSAAEKIKEAVGCPDAEVYFISGGTQTNQLVISTMLKPFQGVIAAKTGHVSLHEAGAIEYTGHKVLEIEGKNGKLCAGNIKKYVDTFYGDASYDHMVFPGMVYISFPTEYGTLYSKKELQDIADVCHEYGMALYVDGARLGYALNSPENDVSLKELAAICDVFYIGGTKVGALCGEAIVFTKGNAPEEFHTQIKQHGALMAKGRLMGVQFDALFTDGLYMEIGKHGMEMAAKLKKIFADKGYKFFLDSPTNQQFIILEDSQVKKLAENAEFEFWEKYDEDHTVVRFCTSWSTTDEDLKGLEELL